MTAPASVFQLTNTADFDFNGLRLAQPTGLQGGSYFSRLLSGAEGGALLVQLPRCDTKQGVVQTEKKKYCDLMFDQTNEAVISWFEKLERKMTEMLCERSALWFAESLELDEIENAFTSPIRSYKSGHYYLVRCNMLKRGGNVMCYNENEEMVELSAIKGGNIEIIPLIEVVGIKFSAKSFQIEINMRQIMVLNKEPVAVDSRMLIQRPATAATTALPELTNNEPAKETAPIIDVETEDIAPPTHEEKPASADPEPVSLVISETPDEDVERSAENTVNEVDEQNESTEPPIYSVSLAELEENAVLEENSEDVEPSTTGSHGLAEVSFEAVSEDEPLALKKPEAIYYDIWKKAKLKAKHYQNEAVKAYLEAKEIKEKYMIDELESESDSDSDLESELESDLESELGTEGGDIDGENNNTVANVTENNEADNTIAVADLTLNEVQPVELA